VYVLYKVFLSVSRSWRSFPLFCSSFAFYILICNPFGIYLFIFAWHKVGDKVYFCRWILNSEFINFIFCCWVFFVLLGFEFRAYTLNTLPAFFCVCVIFYISSQIEWVMSSFIFFLAVVGIELRASWKCSTTWALPCSAVCYICSWFASFSFSQSLLGNVFTLPPFLKESFAGNRIFLVILRNTFSEGDAVSHAPSLAGMRFSLSLLGNYWT
jgi:hypothetical protein